MPAAAELPPSVARLLADRALLPALSALLRAPCVHRAAVAAQPEAMALLTSAGMTLDTVEQALAQPLLTGEPCAVWFMLVGGSRSLNVVVLGHGHLVRFEQS